MRLYMNQSTVIRKMLEYQSQLAFVQAEIVSDLASVFQAKKEGKPAEEILAMESVITQLQCGVDQIQAKIILLKSQLE